jgi:hypothetical protein
MTREVSRGQLKEALVSSLLALCVMLNMWTKRRDNSLNASRQEKSHALWPLTLRHPRRSTDLASPQYCTRERANPAIIPVDIRGDILYSERGSCRAKFGTVTFMFVTKNIDVFIQGFYILHAQDISVNLGSHMLQMVQ